MTLKMYGDYFKQDYIEGEGEPPVYRAGDTCECCKRGALAWHRRRTAGGETMLTLACSHCPAVYERVPDAPTA